MINKKIILVSIVLAILATAPATGAQSKPQTPSSPDLEPLKAEKARLEEAIRIKEEILRLRKQDAELSAQIESGALPLQTSSKKSETDARPNPVPLPVDSPPGVKRGGTIPVCAINDADPNELRKAVCGLAKQITNRISEKIPADVSLNRDMSYLRTLVTLKLASETKVIDESVARFLLEAEQQRTDKQLGGDGRNSGSTTLVAKGGATRFLSWAVENGAVEGSRTGTSLTFRANPVDLIETIANKGGFGSLGLLASGDRRQLSNKDVVDGLFAPDDKFTSALRRATVAFTYDLTRDTLNGAPQFTGNRQQLSAVSVAYNFFNKRDPRNPKWAAEWKAFAETVGVSFHKTAEAVGAALRDPTSDTKFRNRELQDWLEALNKSIVDAKIQPTGENDQAAIEKVRVIIEAAYEKLPAVAISGDENVVKALNTIGQATLNYHQKRKELLDKIEKGEILTFEYTNFREVNSPDLSNFRGIFSKGLWGTSLTFNASMTLFNKKPVSSDPLAKIGRVRDFDFALEWEIPLKFGAGPENNGYSLREFSMPLIGTPTLSFSGKYQRLKSDAEGTDGRVKAGTRGDIAIGQVKLVFPINFSGISFKLPLSLTFANRSDLIKEKTIRGNFGITFDIDPFVQRLRNAVLGGLFDQ